MGPRSTVALVALNRYSQLATDPTRSIGEDRIMRRLRNELTQMGMVFDTQPVPREIFDECTSTATQES